MVIKMLVRQLGLGSRLITGGDAMLRRFNKEIATIKGVTTKRLHTCGLLIKGRSVKICPVATGHLRGSAYVNTLSLPSGPVTEIGYMAAYALLVHEINRRYRAPGTSWKYLEKAMKESIADCRRILSEKAV